MAAISIRPGMFVYDSRDLAPNKSYMPNSTPNQTNITLSITDIKCQKFALTDYGRSNNAKVSNEQYEFSLSIGLTLKENSKQISTQVNSQLFEKKTDRLKLLLAEIKVSSIFFIQNFSDAVTNDEDSNLLIPDSLIQLCSSTTVGILRGMFALKLEKTLYTNAILPLIDPNLLPLPIYPPTPPQSAQ